jgi:hypothetical protein
MNCGKNNRPRNQDLKQSSHNVGMKAVAVQQVRLKLQQKAPCLRQPLQKAEGSLAHIQVQGIELGGPLLVKA